MTLITVFVPLLAWATVMWGIGFLPLLGMANAISILLGGLNPLRESMAVLAVCFGVIPTIFLRCYQLETHYERSRLSVAFLALLLMILLVLTRVQMDVKMGVQISTQRVSMPQLKILHATLKMPGAAAKTRHGQINKLNKCI